MTDDRQRQLETDVTTIKVEMKYLIENVSNNKKQIETIRDDVSELNFNRKEYEKKQANFGRYMIGICLAITTMLVEYIIRVLF